MRAALIGILIALVVMAVLAYCTARGVFGHEAGAFGTLRDPQSKDYCCNHLDCYEIQRGGLTEVGSGYLISMTGEVWPHWRVLWESKDGAWWRCVYMSDIPPKIRKGQTRCLIGPPPGS